MNVESNTTSYPDGASRRYSSSEPAMEHCYIGPINVVVYAPHTPDLGTAADYAKALNWTVVGAVKDPDSAAATMTAKAAKAVITTSGALASLGGESTAWLREQIEAAGGTLHAGVPTAKPVATSPTRPRRPTIARVSKSTLVVKPG